MSLLSAKADMQTFLTARSQSATGILSTVLLAFMHLAVLLVFVVPFSGAALALALGSYTLRMWAITAGYHRYFSHRSFKTSRAFQFVLALLGTMAMQNGPLWWASWHRRHHKHSDTPADIHSPTQRGFFHAHIGWFLDGSHDTPNLANVRDLARYPELRFLDRHKWLPIVAYAAATYLILGPAGLVWGFVVSTIACLHATMCINSLAHVWGKRRFDTPDTSRNNWWLALLTLGEGWHNNHHHDMLSARQGLTWRELDLTYLSLKLLERFGLVWAVRAPRRARATESAHERRGSSVPEADAEVTRRADGVVIGADGVLAGQRLR
jgi:stearoyl-CoA desaturase (Delta-9 desaturase)